MSARHLASASSLQEWEMNASQSPKPQHPRSRLLQNGVHWVGGFTSGFPKMGTSIAGGSPWCWGIHLLQTYNNNNTGRMFAWCCSNQPMKRKMAPILLQRSLDAPTILERYIANINKPYLNHIWSILNVESPWISRKLAGAERSNRSLEGWLSPRGSHSARLLDQGWREEGTNSSNFDHFCIETFWQPTGTWGSTILRNLPHFPRKAARIPLH